MSGLGTLLLRDESRSLRPEVTSSSSGSDDAEDEDEYDRSLIAPPALAESGVVASLLVSKRDRRSKLSAGRRQYCECEVRRRHSEVSAARMDTICGVGS